MSNFYNIITNGRYMIAVKRVKDMLELGDSFISEDALKAEYTPRYLRSSYDADKPLADGKYYKIAAIMDTVEAWGDMIGENNISTTRMAPGVNTMLNEVNIYELNRMCESKTGFHMTMDRIINVQRKEAREQELEDEYQAKVEAQVKAEESKPYERPQRPTAADRGKIHSVVRKLLRDKYHIQITCYYESKLLNMAKKLLRWEEVRDELKRVLPAKQVRLDVRYCKIVWQFPQPDDENLSYE